MKLLQSFSTNIPPPNRDPLLQPTSFPTNQEIGNCRAKTLSCIKNRAAQSIFKPKNFLPLRFHVSLSIIAWQINQLCIFFSCEQEGLAQRIKQQYLTWSSACNRSLALLFSGWLSILVIYATFMKKEIVHDYMSWWAYLFITKKETQAKKEADGSGQRGTKI